MARKISIFLSLAALARQVTATPYPVLESDPETAKDCVGWYNNFDNSTCEYVRSYFTITPEQFHEWNPSLGLDCSGWHNRHSYCIVTQRRLETEPPRWPMTTSSPVPLSPTTTSTSTVAPSPTVWYDMGCYDEVPVSPILEKNMNPAGDDSLTIPKCQDACYLAGYGFAGVQEGNQCWCSSYVGGEWTKYQKDCSIPCTGDSTTFCGGRSVLSVFRAEENLEPVSSSEAVASTGTGAETSTSTVGVAETRSSSGAMRNMALWWGA
jgi:hypothetical protein